MSALGTFGGTLGGVAGGNPLAGVAGGAADEVAGLGLHAISSWILGGTEAALREVGSLIGTATAPNLQSTWFSSTYWQVAALAAMLTIPFLCAAAVQAVARADLNLLGRVVFGYLPVSVLGVSLAAPLTMLLLAATDQMSAAVSVNATQSGAKFLDQAAVAAGGMSALDGSPFFAVLVGLFVVMAAVALVVELLVREAAVYVVVLMLPLAFAALVWPARRVWATRLVELLVSLILSKFVIVAVLSLAAAAFSSAQTGISQLLTAMALIVLSTFAPWTLMRILPFTELAAGAAGMLRNELPQVGPRSIAMAPFADAGSELAMSLPARLRRQAEADAGFAGQASPTSAAAMHTESNPPSRSDEPEPSPVTTPGPSPASRPGSTPDPSSDDAAGAAEPDERPRYVPPEFIRSDQPVRLDQDFVARYSRNAAPASPEDGE